MNFLNLLGGEKSTFKVSKSLLKRAESILNASDYLSENISKRITIKELCEVSNMSQSRFCAYFKDITGLSPMKYLQYLRMAHSRKSLLVRGKRPSDIIDLVAASDLAHLCRSFKKHFGKTPKQDFRNTNQS